MPVRSFKKLLVLVLFVSGISLLIPTPAEAKIEILQIDSNPEVLFIGTILYTSPDGIPDIFVSGGALPEFESGSSLEVFDGAFKVQTGSGDTVTLTCGGTSFQAGGGTSATVSCSQTQGGKVVVHTGSVKMLGLDDETEAKLQWDGVLFAGQSYSIRQGLTSATEGELVEEEVTKQLALGQAVIDPALVAQLQSLPTGDIFKSTALFAETLQFSQIPDSTNIEQI